MTFISLKQPGLGLFHLDRTTYYLFKLLKKLRARKGTHLTGLKANSHGMFSIYVFCAYVENISTELRYALLFLSTRGKHTK